MGPCPPRPDEHELPAEIGNVLHWAAKASRPLADLADPVIGRAVLDSLKLKSDGTAAAAETVQRKRRTLGNAVHCAVDLGEFPDAILREHIDTFGTAVDGRLFFSENVGVVSSSTYYRAWQEARTLALPPAATPRSPHG
ncbi:hypothetical protein [Streptomyces sp. ISL-10]|uniref:hypothetical protein n=1 Tax=Streptomyces sp. ISL-10 TaxID=2819172 RepID=UPI0035AB8884